MVVDGDAQRFGDSDDLFRHLDIGTGRGGIAAGVVVGEDDGARVQL